MEPCGDMHKGGSLAFTDTCSACLRANELPSYNSLVVDLAQARLNLDAATSLLTYLKAQLRQCREAGDELSLAEIRRVQRAMWIQQPKMLTVEEVWALYGKTEALVVIEPNQFLEGVQHGIRSGETKPAL